LTEAFADTADVGLGTGTGTGTGTDTDTDTDEPETRGRPRMAGSAPLSPPCPRPFTRGPF
jgi:hypothetical protein